MWVTKNIRSNGTIDAQANLQVKGDLLLTGSNEWILHTPSDGRTAMYFAPKTVDKSDWDWGKGYTFDKGNFNATNITASGNVTGNIVSGLYGLDKSKSKSKSKWKWT